MAVSTTENEDVVALFDTTSGICFGPGFYTNDEAENFLTWLADQATEGNALVVGDETIRFHEDARTYTAAALIAAVQQYRDENDEDE